MSQLHHAVQVAVAFAELHDTPVRMAAKGVLHGIVPWGQARRFLATRIRRRCAHALRQPVDDMRLPSNMSLLTFEPPQP